MPAAKRKDYDENALVLDIASGMSDAAAGRRHGLCAGYVRAIRRGAKRRELFLRLERARADTINDVRHRLLMLQSKAVTTLDHAMDAGSETGATALAAAKEVLNRTLPDGPVQVSEAVPSWVDLSWLSEDTKRRMIADLARR